MDIACYSVPTTLSWRSTGNVLVEDVHFLTIPFTFVCSLIYFLKNSSSELGFQLTESQIEKFLIYLSELKKWNKKINPTAIKDDRSIITKLFLESLTFTYGFPPPLPSQQGERVRKGVKNILDIGTGGGFPGIPIKIIHPEISFTLVDSSKKKVAFLKHICRQIDLSGVECIAERAEDMAGMEKYIGAYDIILSKGVAEIGVLLKVSFLLLKTHGLLITQKGDDFGIELKGAEGELRKEIWAIKDILEIDKPMFGRRYKLVVIQKCFT